MANVALVLWLVLWPVSYDVGEYLDRLAGQTYPEEVTGARVLLWLWVWVIVAQLLYRPPEGRL